ncbi:hypothetical protein ABK040_007836 [Willaertia magna]
MSEKQKVLLVGREKDETTIENKSLSIITLNHPKYNKPIKYALLTTSDSKTIVMEMNKVGKSTSSWFVQNHVISDGKVYVLTPIDVTFLLLSSLEEERKESSDINLNCKTNYVNFIDIIPKPLQNVTNSKRMINYLCDIMELSDDEYFIKFNEMRVLEYLINKCNYITEQFEKNNEIKTKLLNQQSISGFRKSTKKNNNLMNENKCRIEAIRFLSEYLSSFWSEKLATHFNLLEEVFPGRTSNLKMNNKKEDEMKNSSEQLVDNFLEELDSFEEKKKRKTKAGNSGETPEKKKKKNQTPSRGVQSLKKVNTKGMKTLDSFFKKQDK